MWRVTVQGQVPPQPPQSFLHKTLPADDGIMTDFQCISESLGLTSSAWNCQGIFGHVTLRLKCSHRLQEARWVLTTETSDSI